MADTTSATRLRRLRRPTISFSIQIPCGCRRMQVKRGVLSAAAAAAALAIALLLVACGPGTTAGEHPASFDDPPTAEPQVALATQVDELVSGLAGGSTTVQAASSNPYDYAADNPKMGALVALGTPALAELERRIAASDDGLDAYLMAIAMERIARIDLRAPKGYGWGTAHEFLREWHARLKAVPRRVEWQMLRSDTPDTTASSVALGTPAIPFLLDEVARGNVSYAPAAAKLMRGAVELRSVGEPAEVTPEWARANVGLFAELRRLVEEQQ